MRIAAFVLVALAAGVAADPAAALTVTQREYQRGYRDCSTGNFDPARRAKAYDRGCRAAQNFNSGTRKRKRPPKPPGHVAPPGGKAPAHMVPPGGKPPHVTPGPSAPAPAGPPTKG